VLQREGRARHKEKTGPFRPKNRADVPKKVKDESGKKRKGNWSSFWNSRSRRLPRKRDASGWKRKSRPARKGSIASGQEPMTPSLRKGNLRAGEGGKRGEHRGGGTLCPGLVHKEPRGEAIEKLMPGEKSPLGNPPKGKRANHACCKKRPNPVAPPPKQKKEGGKKKGSPRAKNLRAFPGFQRTRPRAKDDR